MNSLPTALPQADAGFQPYIGLKPFTEQEKDRFFGRDREISILLDKIRANRLTLLLAASGVGKSSLLQAGIMPALRTDSNIELIYHRDWAASPQAFKQAVSDHYGEPHKDNASLKSILRACTLFSSGQQIILLDQFEEFFNYQRFRAEFLPFIEELSAAILDRSLPACFVFSMREDFALELNAFKPFLPGMFDSYFRLEKLTRDQARLAIEEPLKPTGWRFEQDGSKSLLEEVLNDLAKREQERQVGVQELLNMNELPLLVEPPHLQIVCRELWDNHRDEAVKQITHAAYHKAGRAEGILETYFLRKISQFSKKEQELASAAFDHLVGQRATKVAHPLKRLAELTRADANALKLMLDKLQDCAVLRRQKRGEEFWYELYHDIFSESIDTWNRGFKTRQRVKRLIVGTAAVLIAGGLLFAANNWRANYYGRYLQLSSQDTVSARIELHQGAASGLDIFGQRQFRYETAFLRQMLEADKKFDRKAIEADGGIEPELIGRMPITERIPVYMAAGLYKKGRDLSEFVLQENKEENIKLVTKQVAQVRTKASLCVLSNMLKKQNGTVTREVIKALVRRKGKSAVPEIVNLLADSDEYVRSAAVTALGNLQGKSAAPEIVKHLTDRNSEVRSAAVRSLGNLNVKSAASEIVKLIVDIDWQVRYDAVEVLGNLKAEETVPELVKFLTNNNSDMRQYAVKALDNMKVEATVPEIVKLLTDGDSDVRRAAVQALGNLKAKTTRPEIVKLLTDGDSDVRRAAVTALGNLKAETTKLEIIRLLTDGDSDMRSAAVTALGNLQGKSAAPEIVKHLTDRNSEVRSAAVRALGNLNVKSAASEIVKLIADSDWQVRRNAAAALGQLKAKVAITPLLSLLKDTDNGVRQGAAYALGQLKAEAAITPLLALLQDADDYVRGAATKALSQLKAEAAIMPFLTLINGVDIYVRANAAEALGQLKIEAATPVLFTLIEADTDEFTQMNAISALGKLKVEAAAPALLTLLKDTNKGVRRQAAKAFGALKTSAAVPELVKLLTDSDSDVQLQAALALARMNHASPQLQAWQEQAFKDAQRKIAANNADERNKAAQLLAPVFTAQAATLLAQLIDDADQNVAQEAVKAFGFAAEFHPEWMPQDKLIALLQHPDLDLRETAITSLGQLIAFRGEKKAVDFPELDQRVRKALSSMINDPQQKNSTRLTAIDALGNTGREEYAQILFELLTKIDRSQEKEESLHSRCLFWLGRMNYAPARDYVENELHKLEQAKAEWREQRDQNSGSIADKDDAWWQVREYRLGSALARIAPTERGIELLGHPLHYVRQAAVRALAGKVASADKDGAGAALIGKIIQAHQDFDPDDLPSPFPYTAFQAIDLALWNLEYTGTAADLAKLQDILKTVPEKSNIPGQDGAIKERLEWTIERLESKLKQDEKQPAVSP